ncbi:MAG: non-hydrolyzing UDP-N-acetylglucosamine 2-epimerase [Anaerolineales bacterium]
MKIVSVVGARPEFIQAAPLSKVLRQNHEEIVVHTGQHYDYLMSQTFFDELEIPSPDINLEVGSGPHGRQTGEILTRLEDLLVAEQPDLVIVRGDTNSTLAGALAASKLGIPIAHVEAGERSFDLGMPEEINRLVADRLATIHLCVSQEAVTNLATEGITTSVHQVGDVMLDAMNTVRPLAHARSQILDRLSLSRQGYALVTIHRAGNTDHPERLGKIVTILNNAPEVVVFPVHPRTRKALETIDARLASNVRVIEPLGYFDMLVLEEHARLIATDSGGVQREAYFVGVPCLTLRDETEWVETVEAGWNLVVGVEPDHVLEAWNSFTPNGIQPRIFGDGHASEAIVEAIENWWHEKQEEI